MTNKELILNSILESTSHPSDDDIYQQLRMSGKRITLATVYNNLHVLCREGKVRNLLLDEKSERFDKPMRHDHLICRGCGKLSDIRLADLKAQLEKDCGFELDDYDLKLFYRCEACRGRAASE